MQTRTPAHAAAYARYWRNSLSDAELGKGALSKRHAEALEPFQWRNGKPGLIDESVVKTCFADEPEDVVTVELLIRPFVYRRRVEHGVSKSDGLPEVLTPLTTPVALARDGRLFPLPGTVVPRDLLEPQDKNIYTIGELAELDQFLTESGVPGAEDLPAALEDANEEAFVQLWTDYLAGSNALLGQVCPDWPESGQADFARMDYGFWEKSTSIRGFSYHIRQLYDHMRSSAPTVPLFERFASESELEVEPRLLANGQFAERLAHSSDKYPLAPSQREALSHFLAGKHGDILAVNGPPGTGKTTLVLSVVATLWAKAALNDDAPPVILATSTNNQAVTNILDAFEDEFAKGSGPFADRWLPDIKSYGAYFPSKAAAEKLPPGKYQLKEFFEAVESEEYIERARVNYLDAANLALPELESLDVDSVIAALRRRLGEHAASLARLGSAWTDCETIRQQLVKIASASPREMELRLHQAKNDFAAAEAVRAAWLRFLAEEHWLKSLLGFLPGIHRSRMAAAQYHILQHWPGDAPTERWRTLDDIGSDVTALFNRTKKARDEAQKLTMNYGLVVQNLADAEARWRDLLTKLGFEGDVHQATLPDVDNWSDRSVRFPIFQLAVHYWEGRWLSAISALGDLQSEKRKNGRAAMEKRWQRRMMLTPCVVMTCFRLPAEMKTSKATAGGFVDNYLYDFADLLIVDEAGQVLPEVAGASFALARQGLVIGDTLQIPPIWSIPRAIDVGNLHEAGLLDRAGDTAAAYELLATKGKLAASGSVMRVAQVASRWHSAPDMARGMFLSEHRRCFDEIISYSNRLCYHGKLIPMRGLRLRRSPEEEQALPLPSMGYLHIDGIAVKGNGGSRCNQLEADTIAAWLAEHRERLEARYGKPLSQVVGVISPFAGQVRAIRQACQQRGIAVEGDDGLTIGTVHALQGAARPVVLFSPVYSKHADGQFIDKDPSLLNVAVSRAKDAFLVFGDMDVLSLAASTTPRGLLADMLFAEGTNALEFATPARADLTTVGTSLQQLLDAPEHDPYLKMVLQNAKLEVHIVTPWIRPGCMEEAGALEAMADAVRRGVQVKVYADGFSNTHDQDSSRRKVKQLDFDQQLAKLSQHGVEPVVVNRVHSKLVIADGTYYCVGSFNWFSAQRDPRYARSESSLAYLGSGLKKEIEVQLQNLSRRAVIRRPAERA